MNDLLLTLAQDRGFLTRPEILDAGYADRHIKQAKASGLLVRIGAGLYALSAAYRPLTAEARLEARSRAVAHRHRGAVVLTHQSAAAMHGLPLWGTPLDEVHVTRLDGGRGRHEAGVQHHVGSIELTDTVEIDGYLVATPDRCVWELACELSTEAALVTADAALRDNLVTSQSLREMAGQFRTWRGSLSGRLALSLADAGSESPGESRSRYLFWKHGIPRPELQYRVVESNGMLIARTDFAWKWYRHLCEFDGRIKFDGTFEAAGFNAVFREKQREDHIRAQGWGLTRLVWDDLSAHNATTTAQRLKAAMEQSRSLYRRPVA